MSGHQDGQITANREKKIGSFRSLNGSRLMEANKAVKINRWLMKLLGLWPLGWDSMKRQERLVSWILNFISIFMLAFTLVTGSLYTFMKEKDLAIRIKLIGVLSFCVMSCIKYFSLMINRRKIGWCMKDFIENWCRLDGHEEREIMQYYALYGRYGVAMCTCFMYGGEILYVVIMPLLTGNIVIPDTNLTIRPLPYPVYFIYIDPQISPTYEIVYFVHCCSSLVMHTTSIVGCSLAVVLVVHACSQLRIVVSWLDRLVDRKGQENSFLEYTLDARLGIIVEQHVRTLNEKSGGFVLLEDDLLEKSNFISSTEKILREICLVDVLGSTLNLCLLGFDLLTEWEHSGPIAMFTYTCLITSFLFNIFLFCYIGEMLTEECEKVGEKTYMIEWYELPGKTAVGLTLTIATARNPATITAGNLIKLSLSTFSTVLKTSLGYLNILRTLTS